MNASARDLAETWMLTVFDDVLFFVTEINFTPLGHAPSKTEPSGGDQASY